eukprot:GHVO01045405.1.p1 GENE.GHVO01045405.1~~GHVO01045405.1.p1  ORF type:complete len:216 (-),score=30.15 GHVO01045405.1:149-769(-)
MAGIFEYNGSTVVAMAGKDCVAIATDRRLGVNRFKTVATNFPKAFPATDKCYIGLAGLATDIQTVQQQINYGTSVYSLREEREMRPQALSAFVSSLLYSRRFGPWFVSPIVAGLDEDNKPHLAAFDCIGAACKAQDFVVNGTASEQLYGVCESFWKPDMSPEQLMETISQCLLAAVDRDCVSGWGGTVHLITSDQVMTRDLKGRMD